MPDVGDLIGDRYRLVARIAGGGMGEVWRAVDETLKRTVAVKVLHSRVMTDASAGERFRREARAMAALRHPGVADVYDYGETTLPGASGLAYIVMAYVQGQPLSERIAEAGRLGAAETLSIVAQTARALQAAHDVDVVHRDVKPGNLVIEPDGHVVLVRLRHRAVPGRDGVDGGEPGRGHGPLHGAGAADQERRHRSRRGRLRARVRGVPLPRRPPSVRR